MDLPPPPIPRRRSFSQKSPQQNVSPAPSPQRSSCYAKIQLALDEKEGSHHYYSDEPASADEQESLSSSTPEESRSTFALGSIQRGSDAWETLLRLFVADLAFRSVVMRRLQSDVTFQPYTCEGAAVLFVDLSHYSQIAAQLVTHGAHVLSSAVNAYLDRLLQIVKDHGGDVVKFAGDAVLVVWEGGEKDSDLELNVRTAARCVWTLQQQAGSHTVPGMGDLQFRIHCGLSCGRLESEVFSAPVHESMQRLYHSVGGEAVIEIGELVDLANAGEVCVSDDVAALLGASGQFRDVAIAEENDESYVVGGCKILSGLDLNLSQHKEIDVHIRQLRAIRAGLRDKALEEDFIHPQVIRLLSHGGLTPTQISQMRNLCVLFIAMTSNGSSVNWLMEVQSILDKHRCPIVQIIDDDKGVHLVAAVNLYEAIPECSLFGLEVCRELVEKQVGCAIGMASGSTFCGVIGSSSVACRWDITGFPPVRAARLMQFALQTDIEVAVDQSVYSDPMATTRLEVLHRAIKLKGTEGTLPVYTLSDSKSYAAFRVLETVHGKLIGTKRHI